MQGQHPPSPQSWLQEQMHFVIWASGSIWGLLLSRKTGGPLWVAATAPGATYARRDGALRPGIPGHPRGSKVIEWKGLSPWGHRAPSGETWPGVGLGNLAWVYSGCD